MLKAAMSFNEGGLFGWWSTNRAVICDTRGLIVHGCNYLHSNVDLCKTLPHIVSMQYIILVERLNFITHGMKNPLGGAKLTITATFSFNRNMSPSEVRCPEY